MMQQLCNSTQAEWHSPSMSGPSQLDQSVIRSIHRGPSFNYTFPKLTNAHYLILIDVSLGKHNLKLDRQSTYLTTFQFGRYIHTRLPFAVVPAGNMFQ